ncbi:PaaI family thioesterase [Qipengyuania sediminis]|uniref:PaaI family thioesterase n=1 Tax=Qipengyuania sediminis TaxID=1532023 RepID=UPI0019826A76|nr:PaaI family thioesterase [Qipengyuania sediminis]
MADVLTPYARALGIAVEAIDGGVPVLTVAFSDAVQGRPGALHGGAISGLLETAGYAVLRVALAAAGRDAAMKPINLTVQFLASGKPRPTFARARIVKLGRRTANLSVEAWQDDPARPIASAVMNVMVA